MLPSPLLIALQFLTRLPVSLPGMPEPAQIGRSLLWYPLVGLLIGGLLLALHGLLGDPPVVLDDQGDEFAGVAHAVHPQVELLGDAAVEHAQAVVRVGQAQSAGAGAEQHDRA